MGGLRISDSLLLPLDVVTQTLACIGRRGAGKTYLAMMLAEQMLDAQAQIAVLDPVGNWYGLRIAADGKSKGKDIFVIGGEHGDVPILPEAGARIARLLVEKRASAIVDISRFRQGERKRFAADFAEEFFHLKKTQRSAIHFFIEEAQLFIPQRCGPDEARMLGAFENIVRLGRNYGIGATLISQRPQSVNKEVLSQVECLCVLQVNGTHERKALDEWVQEAGADRKLVGELPGLSRGEGYVWSPAWLRVFKRVRFSKKTTFDTSATPEVGRATAAAMLSAVDVEALKADLQEVIEKAEKDDPKVLRRKIAELSKAVPQVDTRALDEAQRKITRLESEVEVWKERIKRVLLDTQKIVQQALSEPVAAPVFEIKRTQVDTRIKFEPKPVPSSSDRHPATSPDGFQPNGPQQKILDAIATFEAAGVPARPQHIAGFCGTTKRARGFEENMRQLRAAGLVEANDGVLRMTGDYGTSTHLGSGIDALRTVLSEPQMRMLGAIRETPGVNAESLAEWMGTTVRARGFEENLRRLRSDDLIAGSNGGLRVAEWLR